MLVPGPNGSLGPYSKNSAIYKCPSDKSETSLDGIRLPRGRSVKMNQYLSDTEAIRAGYFLTGWKNYFVNKEFFSMSDLSKMSAASLFVFIERMKIACAIHPS
jgi:hypothetical protein